MVDGGHADAAATAAKDPDPMAAADGGAPEAEPDDVDIPSKAEPRSIMQFGTEGETMSKGLAVLQQLPAGKRLVQVMLEQIPKALAVERNSSTVLAYLEFLQEHSGGLPLSSPASPAMAVANLLAGKPMMAHWIVAESPRLAATASFCVVSSLRNGEGTVLRCHEQLFVRIGLISR